MEVAGLSFGIIGIAAQLYSAALRGYEILDSAASIGDDVGKFAWRLRTEQLILKKWGDTWNIGDAEARHDQKITDETYRLVVVTLARLTGVLLDVDRLRANYGIAGTVEAGGSGGRKKPGLRKRLKAVFRVAEKPASATIVPGLLLQQNLATLENQSFLEEGVKNPEIAAEMVQLRESAAALKSALPGLSKIRWAVLDRDKSERLIQDVREYNEALYQILPLPSKFATLENRINYKAFSVPFPRNASFTGRENELDKINTELLKQEPVRLAIYGMGGLGKTQLMVEYAHRYRNSFSGIYWVRASRTSTLRAGFAEIAVLTGLAQNVTDLGMQEAAIIKVKGWLEARESGKWLIVFDNGDDVFDSPLDSTDERGTPLLRQIAKLLPNRGCSVITTRDKRTLNSRIARVGIELGLMEEEDAQRLFFERWVGLDHFPSPREETLVGEIVLKLGFLPLAIDQAAAYVHETKISLEDYMARVDAEPESSFQQSTVDHDQYSTSVAKTWELSVSFIDSKFPAAGQLFRLLSFFDNEAISEGVVGTGLFRSAEPGDSSRPAFPSPPENVKSKLRELDDHEHYVRALDALDAMSLARRNAEGKTVWVHDLVHQWMRYRMSKLDRFFWSAAAVETIGHAGSFGVFPRHGSTEPTFHLFVESNRNLEDIRSEVSKIYSHRTTGVLLEALDYFVSSKKVKKALLSTIDTFVLEEKGDIASGDLIALCMVKILYQSDHIPDASDKYSTLWKDSLDALYRASASITWNSRHGPAALSCRLLEQFHDTFQLFDMVEESLKVLLTILASLRSQTPHNAPAYLKALSGDIHAVIGRILMEEGLHRKAALLLRSAISLLRAAGTTDDSYVNLQDSTSHLADCLSVLGRPQATHLATQFRTKKFRNVDALIRAFEAEGKRAQAEGLYAQQCLHAASMIRKFIVKAAPYTSTGYGDAGGKLARSLVLHQEWEFSAALFSYRLMDYELDVAAWAKRDESAPVPPGRILSWKNWKETVEALCQCLEEASTASSDNLKLCRHRAGELFNKVSNASSRGYWIGQEDVTSREEVVSPLDGARRVIHKQYSVAAVQERVEKLVHDVETWLEGLKETHEEEDVEYYLEIEAEMMEEEPFQIVQQMSSDDGLRVRVEEDIRKTALQLSEALT